MYISRTIGLRSLGFFSSTSLLSSVRSQSTCDAKLNLNMVATDNILIDNPMLKRKATPYFGEILPIHVQSCINSDLIKLKEDFKDLEGKLNSNSGYAIAVESFEKVCIYIVL